jgi:DtxR family Mn-dependent transcriptional regulator
MRKKTIEDYVELIYILEKKKDKVHTNDVADVFSISPASVTEIFQKLSEEDYIIYEKYTGVKLTPKGKKIAVETKRKHDTLKSFLMILGVSEHIADEDACKIEHITHPETMKRFRKFVEFVQNFDQEPRWLTRFQHYYSTGNYLPCKRDELKRKKIKINKN